MTTPEARANPLYLTIVSDEKMKPAKTLTMMIAAAVTTRALCLKPWMTASSGSMPWTCSSRVRVTRKTS